VKKSCWRATMVQSKLSPKLKKFATAYTVYVLLILFWIASSLFVKNFITLYNMVTIVIVCTSISLVSLGQNMVILTGGIDLSVGAVLSLATALASIFMKSDTILGVAVALAAGLLIGLFNGLIVSKLKIEPFIVTLGSMGIASGLALYLRPAPGGYISPEFINLVFYSIKIFDVNFPITCFLILVLTTIFGEIVLLKRNLGRMIYAVGGNEQYARLMGVPVDRVKIICYCISGLTAALAGLYISAMTRVGSPFVGDPFTLYSIIAVTLGGTSIQGGVGRYINTVGAAIIVASIERLMNQIGVLGIMGSWFTWIVEGIFLVIVIVLSMKVKGK